MIIRFISIFGHSSKHVIKNNEQYSMSSSSHLKIRNTCQEFTNSSLIA